MGDMVKKALWLFLAASIALAILRGLPLDPGQWYGWAEQQLVDVKEWATGVGDGINDYIEEAPTPSSIIPGADDTQTLKEESPRK